MDGVLPLGEEAHVSRLQAVVLGVGADATVLPVHWRSDPAVEFAAEGEGGGRRGIGEGGPEIGREAVSVGRGVR